MEENEELILKICQYYLDNAQPFLTYEKWAKLKEDIENALNQFGIGKNA